MFSVGLGLFPGLVVNELIVGWIINADVNPCMPEFEIEQGETDHSGSIDSRAAK